MSVYVASCWCLHVCDCLCKLFILVCIPRKIWQQLPKDTTLHIYAFLYISLPPIFFLLSPPLSFCPPRHFVCMASPSPIFLSQHAQRIQQCILISDLVFGDSFMWSLTAPFFWDKTTKSAPHLSVCISVCKSEPPPNPKPVGACGLVFGLDWFVDSPILVWIKIWYHSVRGSYL